MQIGDLRPSKGAVHKRKRIGRGPGSGHGKTSTMGHKGQKARSGHHHRRWSEGGQMPIQRRVPKRGFKNPNRAEVSEVTLWHLQQFAAGTVVDHDKLVEAGVLSRRQTDFKVLATGEIAVALTVKTPRISAGAKSAIEAAGGTVEVLGTVTTPSATPEAPVKLGAKAKRKRKSAARPVYLAGGIKVGEEATA